MLTREDFFRPQPRRYINVPTLIGVARLQSLTNGEMRALRESLTDRKGEPIRERIVRANELLLCQTIVDDDGVRQFSDEDAFSQAFDQAMDGKVTAVLYAAAKHHTGFMQDADWQAIEDAAKNSE